MTKVIAKNCGTCRYDSIDTKRGPGTPCHGCNVGSHWPSWEPNAATMISVQGRHQEPVGDRPPAGALDRQVAGGHYKAMKIQPVEFITANGLGFLEGCIIKRVCRWRAKDGVQDLRKAIHELELLIELGEREAMPVR